MYGRYRIHGLAPGSYRIVSSFDFEDPDEGMMEFVRAQLVNVAPGATAVQDLDLYSR